MPDNDQNPVLGIDLGTTFSAIARWDGRGPRVYKTPMGSDELQSCIYFDPEKEEFLVGGLAFKRGLPNPENMALGIKRHMDDAKHIIRIGGRDFSPIELSSRILHALYMGVSNMYPKGVFRGRGTVVTVPYYFKAHQCENTRKAAELANISCAGILQEPIAASLSYAWQLVQSQPDRVGEETMLVFDLGGGTFDLTLFKLVQQKDRLTFEVLGTGGDDRLGGMDFDECLFNLILQRAGLDRALEKLKAKDPKQYLLSRLKVMEAAIEAKIQLSFSESVMVGVPYVIPPDKSIDIVVKRSEFEAAINAARRTADGREIPGYLDTVAGIIDRLWITANAKASQVQRVVLVGGSSKIPCMRRLLVDLIGEDRIYGDNDPALCVAEGAALYSAYLDDPEIFGREIEITTRTCHALGVKVGADEFEPVIPSNRRAPCEQRKLFTNDTDMDTLVVEVFQGAARSVRQNSKIGEIPITGLPRRPRGAFDIWVTFKINREQKLSVVVKICEADKDVVLKEMVGAFTCT